MAKKDGYAEGIDETLPEASFVPDTEEDEAPGTDPTARGRCTECNTCPAYLQAEEGGSLCARPHCMHDFSKHEEIVLEERGRCRNCACPAYRPPTFGARKCTNPICRHLADDHLPPT